MGFQIELYQKENGKSPVLDSILETDAKMQAKIYREIDLLHGFVKKTQKTPKQELDTALSRMKEFLQKQEQESK